MLPERLQPFATPTLVLDHGYVMLVDVMGDDDAIVQAARVSYAAGTKRDSNDRSLIRYLMRHRHTSPFEQAQIKLEVKLPVYVERQWARHRTASWNEMSGRYSVLPDEFQQTGHDAWRLQSSDNKQGSSDEPPTWPTNIGRPEATEDHPDGCWVNAQHGDQFYTSPSDYLSDQEQFLQRHARQVYQERLDFGVAREQARKDLPLSHYTSKVWTIDLHNLLHFLGLRLDQHAQLEIRLYAEAISQIVKVWVPLVWEAFEDYILHAITLSRMEQQGIAQALNDTGFIERAVTLSGLTGREAKEMREKLEQLYTRLGG